MEPVTANYVRGKLLAFGLMEADQLAVAVSGGADSLALMLLCAEHFAVTALTVDHGLRSEAAAEARQVANLCREHNIRHHILQWRGEKPSSNVQAAAREARYGLLTDWCRENGFRYLATGHHMDDQAETLLLRLARGSGVYGLAGMAPHRDMDGVRLVRPFLEVPKSALICYLQDRDISWIEDPSNQAEQFDRVKIRRLLDDPPVEGFRTDRLAATASRLRRTRDALEYYEARWLEEATEIFDEGYILLDRGRMRAAPEEVVLRGIASICRFAGKGQYVPRMEKVQRLYGELQEPSFAGQTLYGAQFSPLGGDKTLVCREQASCADETLVKETASWDNRFEISVKGDIADLKIRALGEDGWQQLKAAGENVADYRVPRLAALSLPAIFKGTDLQVVPHLGYTIRQDLSLSVGHKRKILTKK